MQQLLHVVSNWYFAVLIIPRYILGTKIFSDIKISGANNI
jgi:hypothetical protein